MANEFKSRVYTDRPAYADFDAPRKFMAIESIVAKRLKEHPNAICSYSGGSDSDIMLHLIERVRKIFDLPKVDYVFFNTGLEMEATKRHVREVSEAYGVDIRKVRPEKNIVRATREYGIPFVSKIMSGGLEGVQKKGFQFPLRTNTPRQRTSMPSVRSCVRGSQSARARSIFCAAATAPVIHARTYSL